MYSDPGDLVVDARCDDPDTTSLIEAIRLDRDALGVTDLDPERNADAVLALQDAKRAGAAGEARLIVGLGEPRQLLHLLSRQAGHHCRDVALVLLLSQPAQPAAPSRSGRRRDSSGELVAACAALLRPGGFLVATPPRRDQGGDPVAGLVELGQAHGLSYWQHVIALAVPIREGTLLAADRDEPRCHLDLVILRKPPAGKAEAGRRSR